MYNPVTYGGSQEFRDLVDWVQGELTAIQLTFFDLDTLRMKETNVAPSKPRTGDIRLADGTNWNPGNGAGFYGYYSGGWVKLANTNSLTLAGKTWNDFN